MASDSNTRITSVPATEPRLRLKPAAPATGHADGAWWPRTRDLAAELPSLLAALGSRLGRIDRVTYQLGEWPAPARRLTVDGHVVRLEGFRSQRAGSLTVISWDRRRLTLLVVPPETGADAAEHALTTAADEGTTEDSTHLLADRGPATEHQAGVPQPV
ncbi:DUF5994 family protein [Amycolatopsis mongoliensis]|uniref:DUF5994 family protein n=1 Tax=Amycolatopsis mongoliensis TaxID=715475 RepID=A0A9Y2NEQ3_9PSEU|nr:DUF5994 family protein [Amycolatopsis sp. 4-36]WIY02986.1 DUF5994 family protein [Amycolatopsis sp. 4-36]